MHAHSSQVVDSVHATSPNSTVHESFLNIFELSDHTEFTSSFNSISTTPITSNVYESPLQNLSTTSSPSVANGSPTATSTPTLGVNHSPLVTNSSPTTSTPTLGVNQSLQPERNTCNEVWTIKMITY